MKKRIMITGSEGFIGKYVVELLKKDYEIIPVTENIFDINWDAYMEKYKPQYLIHLAWVTGMGYLDSKENLYMVQKSIEMYNAFYKNGGERGIFVGTEQEYERKSSALKETDCLAPKSLYAQCKCNLGEILVKASQTYGYGFVWNRLFFIYGPGEKPKRLMPAIIKGMIKGEKVICSCKEYVRDYVHVKDVASGIITSLFSNYTGAVNICGGNKTTIGDIGTTVASFEESKGTIQYRSHEECNQPEIICGDNSLLVSLGWKQQYDLKSGLYEEYLYYKKMYEEEQRFLDE